MMNLLKDLVITYPENLPVSQRAAEIKKAIAEHQVVVVAGKTGSGKTTQIPKICLEVLAEQAAKKQANKSDEKPDKFLIGHTQPRRIAARSVAERLAAEMHTQVGGENGAVGYQVRFTDEVGPKTLVKLMTDGILLNEIQGDRLLKKYHVLIIDEAHERSLNIDFILGYLANLLPQRPDLKVVITSATIDSERFAAHFSQFSLDKKVPIIEVNGRTYPVEIRYRPLVSEDPESEDIDQTTGICKACRELMAAGSGDILVFLSGEGEIRDTETALAEELGRAYVNPRSPESLKVPGAVEVIPLYSRLSSQEQHRVFEPHRTRRIVLATNVAETSLTVPGIKYVVDAGTARISRYSPRTKVQRLPIEPISQASANQRSGRCGRVSDGIAIRLYSEADFNSRNQYTEPEILRTSLASVILQMTAAGLGDITSFPFLDKPDNKAIRDGLALLQEIGALTVKSRSGSVASALETPGQNHLKLTKIGYKLATLPLDPRLGRMLLEADKLGCASEILVIICALSVQDVRERPQEKRPQADQFHARFNDADSDFYSYLHLWRYLLTLQRSLSGSAFRKRLKAEFLNYLRFREWDDAVRQLIELSKPLGLKLRRLALPKSADLEATMAAPKYVNPGQIDYALAAVSLIHSPKTPTYEAIHRSLLIGLLSNIGAYDSLRSDYEGTRGTHFTIWPGSGLNKKRHPWVMAAELVETSRLFARTVAKIDPAWVEDLAGSALRKTYSEPVWSSRKGAAMVTERVLFYGLALVTDRPVLASKIGDFGRELAREMFIEHALVAGDWREANSHPFMRENAKRLEQAEKIEQRMRAIGLVADNAARCKFFDDILPENIVSGAHFSAWWKHRKTSKPDLLLYPPEFLLPPQATSSADFPDIWTQTSGEQTLELQVKYVYDPGSAHDGMSILLPLLVLPRVKDAGFDWLVPGLRAELILGTLRALPKRVRRQLVPIPQTATDITPALTELAKSAENISWQDAFIQVIKTAKNVDITGSDWDEAQENIPSHLRPRFVVVDETRQTLGSSENLEQLQKEFSAAAQDALTACLQQTLKEGLRPLPGRERRKQQENEGANERGAKTGRANSLSGAGSATRSNANAAADRSVTQTGLNATKTGARRKNKATAVDSLRQENITDLPTQPLPLFTESVLDGYPVRSYPAAVVEYGQGEDCISDAQILPALWGPNPLIPATTAAGSARVNLEMLTDAARQERAHRGGVQRLVLEKVRLNPGRITSRWTGAQALTLASSPYANTAALVEDCQRAALGALLGKLTAADLGHANPSSHGATATSATAPHPASSGAGLHSGAPNGAAAAPTASTTSPAGATSTTTPVTSRPSMSPDSTKKNAKSGKPRAALGLADLQSLRDEMFRAQRAAAKTAAPAAPTALTTAPAALTTPSATETDSTPTQKPAPRLPGAFGIRSSRDIALASYFVKERLEDEIYRLAQIVTAILSAQQKLASAIENAPQSISHVVSEVKRQQAALVFPGFLTQVPYQVLPQIPRYLQAAATRIEKASMNLERDEELQAQIDDLEAEITAAYDAWQQKLPDFARYAKLEKARWLLEELRVSLFAQTLGTSVKVSAPRIIKLLK